MNTNTHNRFRIDPLPCAADLIVTFMDGHVERVKDVRYNEYANEVPVIKVNGTTVEVETLQDNIITLCGVRFYEFA